MNGPCDFVQFNYYGVSVLLIITSQKNQCHSRKKIGALEKLVRCTNWCAGNGIK